MEARIYGDFGVTFPRYTQLYPHVVNRAIRRCPQPHPQVCAQDELSVGSGDSNVGAGPLPNALRNQARDRTKFRKLSQATGKQSARRKGSGMGVRESVVVQ